MNKLKIISYYFFGAFYIFTGVLHFVVPQFYIEIMPPYLPWHLELIYISGVAEFVLGVGLMIPKYRRKAAIGIILLLIAVFPANIHLAFSQTAQETLGTNQLVAGWIRLPFQAIFIAIAWWQSKD